MIDAWVRTDEASYPIITTNDFSESVTAIGTLLRTKVVDYRQILVVTDSNIPDRFLGPVRNFFQTLYPSAQCEMFILEPGEGTKSLSTANQLWTYLIEQRYTRDALLIALGGGVVGDLTGFIASTFLRGISFLQCPTTLLAQVDASIGGKTAINHPLGKNLIGTFYQPIAVVNHIGFLETLPQRELTSALAEVIKYSLIAEPDFLTWIEAHLDNILNRDRDILREVVSRCSAIKADFVNRDPKERQGLRVFLNFGHTLAHALEVTTDFKTFLHGEAVAIGMVYALYLSEEWGFPGAEITRIESLLIRCGLTVSLSPEFSAEALISAMWHDKKNDVKSMRFVLLKNVGFPEVVSDLSVSLLRSTLLRMGASLEVKT